MDKLVLGLVLVIYVRVVHGGATITSCSQTPFPNVCQHYVTDYTNNHLSTQDEIRFGFRELALRATMNQAEQAHRLVSAMDLTSFNQPAKLAWADCLELYEDSIQKLNRSIISTNNNTPTTADDAQTWLSAALANHQTCQKGFTDFNLSSHLQFLPLMLTNFSQLLSNSLAINKASVTPFGGRRLLAKGGFPTWISAADRKLLQTAAAGADIVVANDGSGDYQTITEAVAASVEQRSGTSRFVIHVKAGVYKENVVITKSMKNLMFIGDGIGATVVTGSASTQGGSTTFRSATLGISGDGFIARDMTFENTAGPQSHQAVAVRSSSDFSTFYHCSFEGYQDTLYVYSQRQFYRECDIYGTIDFICGDAVTVFQSCNIYVRKPLNNQWTTITAQSRTDPNQNTGIIIQNSRVTASSDLKPVQGSFKTYLGRPWQKYSRVVFMKCSLDSLIDPAGWLEWSGNFALSTLYYGEYMNTGSGASTSGRVEWPGYHVITSVTEAGKFTAGNFLGGNSWIPATGVPYAPGL